MAFWSQIVRDRSTGGSNHKFQMVHLSDPWASLGEQGYSENAQDMINASATDLTKTVRFKYIDQFRTFLSESGCTSSFSQVEIINFLAEKFAMSLSEFKAARTAISTTLRIHMGEDIMIGILFKRQSRGATNLKPRQPKYDEMWDLSVLLDFLMVTFPIWPKRVNISARCRANVLVRMSVAGRNNDVAYIYYPSLVWTETTVSFSFYNWKTKHTEGTRLSRRMTIRKLPENKIQICAYTALKTYMDIHAKDYERLKPDDIWLHFGGGATMSVGGLAKDCKDLMKAAGISLIYGAGTIQLVTITYWVEQGIPYEFVMTRTGHRSAPLVRKYYDKSRVAHDIMASLHHKPESDEDIPPDVVSETDFILSV
jgi:hypothetical protein